MHKSLQWVSAESDNIFQTCGACADNGEPKIQLLLDHTTAVPTRYHFEADVWLLG